MSRRSAHQRERTLREAYAALEAVRARVTRLRYRGAATCADRDALEEELYAAEDRLLGPAIGAEAGR